MRTKKTIIGQVDSDSTHGQMQHNAFPRLPRKVRKNFYHDFTGSRKVGYINIGSQPENEKLLIKQSMGRIHRAAKISSILHQG